MTSFSTHRPLGSLVALIGLVVLATTATSAAANPGGTTDVPFPPPTMTDAWTNTERTDAIVLVGHDFTPGGRVEVALYDQSGTQRLETRWTTATVGGFVRDWRDGPAAPRVGISPAGVISAPFAVACGTTAKVRALDQQTARWSDWLDVNPGC